MEFQIDQTTIKLALGDLTKVSAAAIVNAAHPSLLGGGGVDGAIHRAGGPEILAECQTIGGCKTGEAVITTGGNLPAWHVIHTVGPVWEGGNSSENILLESCYKKSLELALKHALRTVAFPAISCGTYKFPVGRAGLIAVKTVCDFVKANPGKFDTLTFVIFGEDDFKTWQASFKDVTFTMLG